MSQSYDISYVRYTTLYYNLFYDISTGVLPPVPGSFPNEVF